MTVTEEASKKVEKASEKLKLEMDKVIFDQIVQLARLEDTDTYVFINRILADFVADNEYKLDAHLNPVDAADKADKLFAEAVRMQRKMSAHAEGSRERIAAEAQFITVLQRAAALFAEITRRSKGSEIEKHIQLRMNQISALCDQQLTDEQNQKENTSVEKE
ncbi:MAG: hypothetical protein KGS72_25500 [Cyanobacteria bacterium REEB67]|nr:hypothetical protein [Cyanobacteria bacterium REEB67]